MAAKASATMAATEAGTTDTKPSDSENGATISHSETAAQGNLAVTHKRLIIYLKLIVDRHRQRDQRYFRTAEGCR